MRCTQARTHAGAVVATRLQAAQRGKEAKKQAVVKREEHQREVEEKKREEKEKAQALEKAKEKAEKDRIAKEKALSVLENYPNEIIIASDQILICEDKVISKPKSLEEATKKLLFLIMLLVFLKMSIQELLRQAYHLRIIRDFLNLELE